MKHFILMLALFSAGFAFADDSEDYADDADYAAEGFVAEESAEGDDLAANGFDLSNLYNHCRRKFGPDRYCRVFVDGARHSARVFDDLMHRHQGDRRAACGMHRRYFNREIEPSFKPRPYKKGFVFFGREIAHCGG